MNRNLLILLSLLTTLIIGSGCRRNDDKRLWDMDVLAPLVQSSLSLKNIVRDTAAFKENPDNTITVVSRQALASVTLDSLVALNTPSFDRTEKLSSLVLDTRYDTTRITLGQIADQLIASGGSNIAIGAAIKYYHGSTLPAPGVPDINNLSSGSVDIDVSTFFQTADINTGTMDIKITNDLPLTLGNADLFLKNKNLGTTIMNQGFTNITPGTSQTVTQNLAGMTVEGMLEALISNLDIIGSGGAPVPIDTNDAIEVVLIISNVTVSSATAVFPDQVVIDNSDEISLEGMNDKEVTFAKIASGGVRVEVISTIQDNVYFNYKVPSATLGGVPFETDVMVPAAPAGGSTNISQFYPFDGYDIDFTGENHDTINTIFNELIGEIRYSGIPVSLSLNDSMTIRIYMENLRPSYVRGYLGKDTLQVGPATADMDIFKNIESGTLNFENVNLNLTVDNGVGLGGQVIINSIVARNTRTGAMQTLTGPNIGVPITINPATDMPYTKNVQVLDMSTGSNATSLLNILPDKIDYSVEVKTNLAGNLGTYTDFAYNTGGLSANLDIEMPLSFLATDLVLSDTIDFDATAMKKQSVKKGKFTVMAGNGFPLEAALKIYFLDATDAVLDSMVAPTTIQPAPVDGTFKVTEKNVSYITFNADEERMNNIYHSKKVIFKVKFTTQPPAPQFLKVYSDYAIDFKMIGDMTYTMSRK